jgi:hypothetical protein
VLDRHDTVPAASQLARERDCECRLAGVLAADYGDDAC